MSSGADVPINYNVTADGLEDAASGFADVASGLDQVSSSSEQTSSSLDDVASSFGTTTDQITDTRSALRMQNAAVNDNWNSWKLGHTTLADSQKAFQSISTIGREVTSMVDTLTSAQTNLNTANANVASTENAVTTAQANYNAAVAQYGSNSSEASAAQKILNTDIDAHTAALTAASAAQAKYQAALVGIAMQLPNVAFNVLNLVMGLNGMGLASTIAGAAHSAMAAIYVAGTGLMTAAQTAFDVVASMNPIVLIALAIIAIMAVLYEAWTNDWGGIREKFQAVVDFLEPYIMPVINAISAAFSILTTAWDDFTQGAAAAFQWLGGVIGETWSDVWGGIKVVLNEIIDGINTFIGGLNAIIGGINDVAGLFGVSIATFPTIPNLAAGALVSGPTVAMIGEGSEQEVVSPVSKLPAMASALGGGSSGGGAVVNNYSMSFPNYVGDKQDLLDMVMQGLKRQMQRRTGTGP